MPKVTSLPCEAAAIAVRTALKIDLVGVDLVVGGEHVDDGVFTETVTHQRAAAATAAAVLRAIGSSRMVESAMSSSRACSATRKRNSSLVMTIAGS
jgi:hypothetical protein